MVNRLFHRARLDTIRKIQEYRSENRKTKPEKDNKNTNRLSKSKLISFLEEAKKRYGEDLTSSKFANDDDFCASSTIVNRFGSWTDAIKLVEDIDARD